MREDVDAVQKWNTHHRPSLKARSIRIDFLWPSPAPCRLPSIFPLPQEKSPKASTLGCLYAASRLAAGLVVDKQIVSVVW
jgi:hypothetical protein